jgi:acetyl esterase/lipase
MNSAARTPVSWLGRVGRSLVTATAFGLVALICAPLAGVDVGADVAEERIQLTWFSLFSGVFAAAAVTSWFVMSWEASPTWRQGAAMGGIIALMSYPAVVALGNVLQSDRTGPFALFSVLAYIWHVAAISLLGLLTTGFAVGLTFALFGTVYALIAARLADGASAKHSGSAAKRNASSLLLRGVAAVLLVLAGAFLALTLIPVRSLDIPPVSAETPIAPSYQDAIALFERIESQEANLALHPRCGSALLSHGNRTERAVVYFHGLTSCPAQADMLAKDLFAQGYNVFVPRLPGHGEADRLTLSLATMTAEDLVQAARDAILLASGLGDEVAVVGLSAGGTMTMHMAQNNAGVGQVVSVAPFMAPYAVPPWAAQAATNLLFLLPNLMVWWNPLEQEGPAELDYAYPRYATHALAQVMRLGRLTDGNSRREAPLAGNIGLILNQADRAINNPLALRVARNWSNAGSAVDIRTLPAELDLPHDLVDPRQPGAQTGPVYALLIDMLNGAEQ